MYLYSLTTDIMVFDVANAVSQRAETWIYFKFGPQSSLASVCNIWAGSIFDFYCKLGTWRACILSTWSETFFTFLKLCLLYFSIAYGFKPLTYIFSSVVYVMFIVIYFQKQFKCLLWLYFLYRRWNMTYIRHCWRLWSWTIHLMFLVILWEFQQLEQLLSYLM